MNRLIDKYTLGILYKDNKIVNHRSAVKVLFNPLLRYFGYQIVSIIDDSKITSDIKITKCNKVTKIRWTLEHNDYDRLIKKRIFI